MAEEPDDGDRTGDLVAFLCAVLDDVALHPALRVEAGLNALGFFARSRASKSLVLRQRDATTVAAIKRTLVTIALTSGGPQFGPEIDAALGARIRAAGAAL